MTSLADKATAFLDLHQPGNPVILPTVWDAWSAKLVAEAGFRGLTIGSHPLADSMGKADKEGMTFAEVLVRVREITATVDIPVSVDLESGYAEKPSRIIEGLLEAGAIGFNIEDSVHSEGGRLRSPQEHADLVAELRSAADAAGVPVVINARTDVFLRPDTGTAQERLESTLTRMKLAAQAGASVLYPVGRHEPEVQRTLTAELPLPVNAIGLPGQSSPAYFAELGVARVSFGPFFQAALTEQANQLLAGWR
ncbi:isocitrate lyase/phosphoenolpyruvate mutase family protein [Nocardia yunnanensis]|uniref:Isocitrate lyase/phosphoenolpyruvate mutase family protein n=1 Tax=Nocardia yunnanensis TaxID=2382165 RepID=A0A386ZHL7_9NOCA|nr:isocitrate lyase/phosphoenolpyruvate mutase family protein [Nocardia yunnanensis]AYF76059.1 isocitrate lyase/phosphoenolpyruvate mutase family protein [Nocardia yunnanensis]